MRLFKTLIILILSFAIIIFVAFYFFQRSISDNLKQKNKDVAEQWSNFNSDLMTRDSLLASLISNSDSLKYWLQNSIRERNKKENNLDLLFYEYKVNEFVLTHFANQKQVSGFNNELNNDISKYNSITEEYNKYISVFPNFIVAKNHNYKRAKFFDISYGRINRDPVQKSKELPEWAKGVDTN
ncbi:MAG: LemA family protein [Parafilimonas sp.]